MMIRKLIKTNGEEVLQYKDGGQWIDIPIEKEEEISTRPEMVYVQSDIPTKDFLIGKYPVTQSLYESVMEINPSNFKGVHRPVENVSWYDAVEFCNKLSQREGLSPAYSIEKNRKDSNNTNDNDGLKWLVTVNLTADGYRLPTEAEWEFAARGGLKSKGFEYAGSNELSKVGWFKANSGKETHTVGQLAPNELGIHDLSGNVLEWCWDWFEAYPNSDSENPIGASSGSFRVLRGGSWYDNIKVCRVAYRNCIGPYCRGSDFGFRLVRSL